MLARTDTESEKLGVFCPLDPLKNFEQSERCFSALEPVRRIALGTARGVVVEAAGAAGVPSTMGDDPFYVNMTHASNRQYNRQNPSFDSRPPETLTGMRPSRLVAPDSNRSTAPPGSQSIRLS